MKLLPLVLIGSLAANAAGLVYMIGFSPSAGTLGKEAEESRSRSEQLASARSKAADEAAAEVASQSYRAVWGLVDGGDLKGALERMKKLGYPESVVRWIIKGKLQEDLSNRMMALQAKRGETPYWKTPGSFFDAGLMAESRALNQQYNEKLMELLGPSAAVNPGELAFQKFRFGNLAPEKLQQLQRLSSDYQEMRMQIQQGTQGMLLAEDREKLAFIDKEEMADLQRLLTAEELASYEMRSSSLAGQLKGRLMGFDVTEDEYRQLYAAAKTAAGGTVGFSWSATSFANFGARNNVLLDAARSIMTPERFAAFELATDPQYSQTSRLITRLNLPATATATVVAVQRDSMKSVQEIRSNRQLTPAQQTEQLNALKQQVTQQLTTVLGERGMSAYQETAGSWMRMMTAPVAPPRTLPGTSTGGGGGTAEPVISIAPRG